MARRDLLTGDERRALFGVPLDHASLAKHYTVADEDRPLIEAKRGDANRLGFALHLALLRHPGFGIRHDDCLLYTSPSPRDATLSRMPSSA